MQYFTYKIDSSNYYSSDPSFVNSIINTVNYKALEKIFLDFGIILCVKDWQAFPLSIDGKNVVELLEHSLLQNGVKIDKNCEISRIEKKEKFTLFSGKKTLPA